MRTVRVTIEGTTPILLHNPSGMARPESGKGSPIPPPDVEAAASCYWTDKTQKTLGYPADNIKGAMIIVSSAYKAGKQRLTPYVSGSVYLEPPMLSFGTAEYEVDTRRAVIQRQGILRSRARIPKWRLSFDLVVDDDFPVVNLDVLKKILDEAGRRVGIGDYRPAKKGWFGKFRVIEWVELAGTLSKAAD